MKTCVYPGSFDPITNGHLDIIDRASKLCDKLIIGILVNDNKKPFFSLEERTILLKRVLKDRPNIEIQSFSGLLIDFVREKKAEAVVRGLRAVSDFEYEFQMASLNKTIDSEIETLFMMTNVHYSYLSSSIVKELAKLGGKIEGLVPECIIEDIYLKCR